MFVCNFIDCTHPQPTVVGSLESLYELWLDSNTINSIPEVQYISIHNYALSVINWSTADSVCWCFFYCFLPV